MTLSQRRRIGFAVGLAVAAAERWIDTFARPIVELRRRDPEAALAWARTGEGRRWSSAEFRAAHDATVLLVTGGVAAGLAAGATDHLAEPYSPRELVARSAPYLERRPPEV